MDANGEQQLKRTQWVAAVEVDAIREEWVWLRMTSAQQKREGLSLSPSSPSLSALLPYYNSFCCCVYEIPKFSWLILLLLPTSREMGLNIGTVENWIAV